MNSVSHSAGRFFLFGVSGAVLLLAAVPRPAVVSGELAAIDRATPEQIFEERIMPIFRSAQPSSCTQCHLAGVDLKNYILPSHEKTFLALRDQGLVNLDRPEESKILRMIRMGDRDAPAASVLHAKVRQAEFAAFSAWIRASCDDPRLRNAPRLSDEDRNPPAPPAPVPLLDDAVADARTDKLQQSFDRTIWAMKGRCNNCHQQGGKDTAKHVAKYGERVVWMKEDAKATMTYLLSSKLLDPRQPGRSLLLLKPMALVEHGGGKKIMPNDPCHLAYLTWLRDYSVWAATRKVDAVEPQRSRGELGGLAPAPLGSLARYD